MENVTSLKILKIFDIFIIISLFIISNNLELNSLKYPNAYVLLSQNITLVTSEGIRFFSSKMELDESKYVELERPIGRICKNNNFSISC